MVHKNVLIMIFFPTIMKMLQTPNVKCERTQYSQISLKHTCYLILLH